jgi:hypothetical protein
MKRRVVCCLAFAVVLLPACTSVLGMEEAKLDNGGAAASGGGAGGGAGGAGGSAGLGGPRGVPRSGTACEQDPGPACTECLETNCSSALEACVGSTSCRTTLDKFAACLGPTCSAEQETCTFGIDDPELRRCMGSCSTACGGVTIASQCELYCACMAQCPAETAQIGNCLTTCAALPAEVRICRRDHCEYQPGDPLHCRHASGRLDVCKSFSQQPKPSRTTCLDGKESTWACNDDTECCSNNCLDGSCS